jgi:predicted lipoprotein with Yx(FWY)xxD motif
MRKLVVEVESMQRFVLLAVFGATVVTLLAMSGTFAKAATEKTASSTASLVVSTKTLPKLGTVLVNAQGLTLYMFVPDARKKVTCVGGCAVAWPPLKVAAGAKVVASGSVKAALLGSDADPAGGRVVTYDGWPLYRWVGDTAPGKATGQALNANGGLWYVLGPSGTPIKTALAKTTAKGSTTTKKSSGGAQADGCPAGTTIEQSSQNDQDADNFGGADDFDGCL